MPTSDLDRSGPTAADVIGPLLVREVSSLRRHEALLADDPEAVHEYRVTTRRLRSVLAGYAPLFEPDAGRSLRRDLRRAGAIVGDLRDAQVLAERIEGLLVDEPTDSDVTTARSQVARMLRTTAEMSTLLEHLGTSEYDGFVRRLERFCDFPPWTPAASWAAPTALRPLLHQEWSRFRSRSRNALEEPGHASSRLHEARKAAKRARYVFEAAEPVFGRRARRNAKTARRLQHVLGVHRDSTLAQELLLGAATSAAQENEDTIVLARLRAREIELTDQLRTELGHLIETSDRTKLRHWLS